MKKINFLTAFAITTLISCNSNSDSVLTTPDSPSYTQTMTYSSNDSSNPSFSGTINNTTFANVSSNNINGNINNMSLILRTAGIGAILQLHYITNSLLPSVPIAGQIYPAVPSQWAYNNINQLSASRTDAKFSYIFPTGAVYTTSEVFYIGNIGSTPKTISIQNISPVVLSGGNWTSSANNIATVNTAGIVTAVANGYCRITYNEPSPSTGSIDFNVIVGNEFKAVVTSYNSTTKQITGTFSGSVLKSGNGTLSVIEISNGTFDAIH